MHKDLKAHANKEGLRNEGRLQTINIQRQDKSEEKTREEKTREEKKRKEKSKKEKWNDRLTFFSNKEDVDYFTSNSFQFMVDVLFAPYLAAIFQQNILHRSSS